MLEFLSLWLVLALSVFLDSVQNSVSFQEHRQGPLLQDPHRVRVEARRLRADDAPDGGVHLGPFQPFGAAFGVSSSARIWA